MLKVTGVGLETCRMLAEVSELLLQQRTTSDGPWLDRDTGMAGMEAPGSRSCFSSFQVNPNPNNSVKVQTYNIRGKTPPITQSSTSKHQSQQEGKPPHGLSSVPIRPLLNMFGTYFIRGSQTNDHCITVSCIYSGMESSSGTTDAMCNPTWHVQSRFRQTTACTTCIKHLACTYIIVSVYQVVTYVRGLANACFFITGNSLHVFFKTIFNLLETLNAPQWPQTCSWKDRCFKNATEFKKVFESNWVNVQVAYKQPKSAAKLSKSQLVNKWSADSNILKCAWRCPEIKREIGGTFLSYHHQ